MNNSVIETHPSEVEAALTSHPCVEAALAFTVTPSTGRKQSGCLVTLKSGRAVGKQSLRSHAARALSPSTLDEVIVVSEIPRDGKGRAIASRVQDLIKHHLDGRRRQPSLSFAVAFSLPANVNPLCLIHGSMTFCSMILTPMRGPAVLKGSN